MPFYRMTDDGCWVATTVVDLRHLEPEGQWFKKVTFELLNTIGYSKTDLPVQNVKRGPEAEKCVEPANEPEGLIVVEQGSPTDLASVPAFLWGVVASYGQHTLPAIVHDNLYKKAKDATGGARTRMMQRRAADELFRISMSEVGVPWAKQWVMWSAVRFGGVWAEFSLFAALWLVGLVGVLAVIPYLILAVGDVTNLPLALLWSIAVIAPIVLAAMSRWLLAALIWALLLVPVGIAFVTSFVALTLIWFPSFVTWLIKTPKALVTMLTLWLITYFGSQVVNVPGLELVVGILVLLFVLIAFRGAGNPPPIGPTRK